MILSKKQGREEEKREYIYWACGYGQLDSSSHFLTGKLCSPNPEKPINQNVSNSSKGFIFSLKSRSHKSKMLLKPKKQKLSLRIREGVTKQSREEVNKQFYNIFQPPYPQQRFNNKRNAYPIPNMSNGKTEEQESNVVIQVTSSGKMSLKQTVPVNNFSSGLQKQEAQLTFNDDKLLGYGLLVQRQGQESKEQRQKTKRQNDDMVSHLSCSLNLDSLKDEYHLDEGRFNSHTNMKFNEGRFKGLLSPVKSLTSLKDMIETESISDEKSQDSKQSVVVGRLSYNQLPVMKTYSREETAAASSMINKIFKSQAKI